MMHILRDLPEDIVRKIFTYIIPEIPSIFFYQENSQKYQTAYSIGNHAKNMDAPITDYRKIMNKSYSLYLSRIWKKNRKHRYYLSEKKETLICGCGLENCRSRYCNCEYYYECSYSSKYVGKNIHLALLELQQAV
jgi:hypothetical protein